MVTVVLVSFVLELVLVVLCGIDVGDVDGCVGALDVSGVVADVCAACGWWCRHLIDLYCCW